MKSIRVRTVQAGDRLPLIAEEMYGDPRFWRLIAEANNIEDPLRFPEPHHIGWALAIPGR